MVAHKPGTALYQALPMEVIGAGRGAPVQHPGSAPRSVSHVRDMAKPQSQRRLNDLRDGKSGRRIQTFKQFVVHDDACGMKVGTDALLLGSWAGACKSSMKNLSLKFLILARGQVSCVDDRPTLSRCEGMLSNLSQTQPCKRQKTSREARRPHHRAPSCFSRLGGEVDWPFAIRHSFMVIPKVKTGSALARHDDTLPLSALFTSVKACLIENGNSPWSFPKTGPVN